MFTIIHPTTYLSLSLVKTTLRYGDYLLKAK